MCFFFKKKPKFKQDEVDGLMSTVMSHMEFPGFPARKDRNDDNYQISLTPTQYSRGVNIKGTVDGNKMSISVFFSMDSHTLSFYMTFENISFDKRYAEQRALNDKYPQYKFTYNNNGISVDKMLNENGKKVLYYIKCKTMEDITLGIEKFCQDFTYDNVYNNVVAIDKGQRIGE